MKMSEKDKKTLLFVMGILMVVAVYFLYFTNEQTENEKLEKEVDQLRKETARLEEYDANSEKYKSDTRDYYSQIDEIVNQFPAEVKEETSIMYARELEEQLGIGITNVSISPVAELNSFGVGEREKHLFDSAISISFTGNYDEVKNLVNYIQQYQEKRNITSLAVTFDRSTGNLAGTADINLFALSSKEKAYRKPDTGITNHGTQGIFGQ